MTNDNGREYLSDEQLEIVTGGMSWKAFGVALLEKMDETGDSSKYKQIRYACKAKDWVKVAELAVPLLAAGDPIVMEAYRESKR